jgi:hypothetical protein
MAALIAHEHVCGHTKQRPATGRGRTNREVPAIFEGAFEHRDVLIRVDILQRRRDQRWRLIESILGVYLKRVTEPFQMWECCRRSSCPGAG